MGTGKDNGQYSRAYPGFLMPAVVCQTLSLSFDEVLADLLDCSAPPLLYSNTGSGRMAGGQTEEDTPCQSQVAPEVTAPVGLMKIPT